MLDCVLIHCFPPYDDFLFFFLVESQDVRHEASGDRQLSLRTCGGMSD